MRFFISVFLSAIFYLGLTTNFFPQNQKPIPPLVYNHIASQENAKTLKEKYFFVTPENFESQLSYLKGQNFNVVAFYHFNTTKTNMRLASLVFQGGYGDFYNALPILKRNNLTATVLVDPKKIGADGYLTQDQLATLQKDPQLRVIKEDYQTNSEWQATKKEVSGTINLAQFADLLGNQEIEPKTINSLAASVAIFMVGVLATVAPNLAILLAILAIPTFWIRFQLFGIPTNIAEVAIGAIFAVQFFLRPKELKFKIPKNFALPLAFVTLGFILNIFLAPDRSSALGFFKSFLLVPLALYTLIVNRHKNFAWKIWPVVALSTTIIAGLSLWLFGRGYFYQSFDGAHLTTFFGNPNYLASYLQYGVIFLTGALLLAISEKFFYPAAIFYVPMLIITATSLRLADSKGAVVAIMAAALYLIYHSLPGPRFRLTLLTVLVLALLSAFALWSQPSFQPAPVTSESSVTSRYFIWQTAWKIFKTHPLGIGLANFGGQYRANVPADSPEKAVDFAHNTYLDFATQTGVFGLIGFIWLLAAFVWYSHFWANPLNFDDLTAKGLMIVFAVHSLFDSEYFKNDYAVIFWMIVATAVLLRKNHSSRG